MKPITPNGVFDDFASQPNRTAGLRKSDRDKLIISLRVTEGLVQIISRYGDDVWWITLARRNTRKSDTKIDFTSLPEAYRQTAKAILYRYIRRGAIGSGRAPACATIVQFFRHAKSFFEYLAKIKITSLSSVTDLALANYFRKIETKKNKATGKPYSRRTVDKQIKTARAICDLSQFTDDPTPSPLTTYSSNVDVKLKKKKIGEPTRRTPLMPDDVFTALFNKAWGVVTDAARLLRIRSNLDTVHAKNKKQPTKKYLTMLKTPALSNAGFSGTFMDFKLQLKDIRIACYIIIASLSGCRVHELANLKTGAYYSTVGDDGERYWWLRSESNKTYEGLTEWMVPEAAITAIRVLEQWAAPYQERIRAEIQSYHALDEMDSRIAEAREHAESLFLGADTRNGNLVRTLATQAFNNDLREFAESCGLSWIPTTHQFRRKFANYVAHSKFGDLRYLREHFKHWSIMMTLGYALNESQDMSLFLEIRDELDDIKFVVVDSWLNPSEPLTGGYGKNLVAWRQSDEAVTMFKSRADMVRSIATSTAIRSNGHAWCTADHLCVGNNFDKTRCGAGCENGVVGKEHRVFYSGLLAHLNELGTLTDIGPGGVARVQRDVARCEDVLAQLG
ncbi:tyrosine-type recombinase/integrase [Ralstonia mannitolilytica]|uniref:Site-specific recombinase XerD n=1 Tax=Ralstonia mannitolilytica TaxID=105219 RepID=A0AAJ4ZIU5_9RALS|nr:tyrosine-type recombinase/integrase [Ralstonia mannitolilytica]CAG2152068.1 hypothetical protein LMG6866_04174 [Ralstonia mannitolilytica]CAJ0726639.1 hypothetical protein R77592_01055 [Ralstonia mannitolilytica]SUD86612.1 Site-specific recombinase XerD [Ralstonia mannitolilytica]SUD96273.1 Site-specific recombinase XerD [Ralstonia mannitolilytica]